MLHFTGIKKSLYDFQNIPSLYWKRLRSKLRSQLSLDGGELVYNVRNADDIALYAVTR